MALNTLRRFVRTGRNFELTWRYLFNFAPTLSYRMKHPSMTSEAERVLADLNRDGIAITSAKALFGQDLCFDELCQAFDRLQLSVSDHLSRARENAFSTEEVGEKSFIFEYLGHSPVLDPREVYARFALHENVLQIANAYLGMHTRLRYYNIWHTFATQAEARESQLWHRDREDRYILKAFVYLCDVGEGAGPFTYAAGSHAKGSVKTEPESFLEGGVKRSTDPQMAKVVSPERWIKGVGPKGTIIFADTRGYHKGGLAREQDRIMYTCMFTSPASESREFLRRTANIPYPNDKARAFALAAPKGGAWLSWRPGGF
jgi:hypothetical protein